MQCGLCATAELLVKMFYHCNFQCFVFEQLTDNIEVPTLATVAVLSSMQNCMLFQTSLKGLLVVSVDSEKFAATLVVKT